MTTMTFLAGVSIGIVIGALFTTAVYYLLFESFKRKMNEVITIYETLRG